MAKAKEPKKAPSRPRKPLTDQQRADARRLKSRWEAMPPSKRPTQEQLARLFSEPWGGDEISQSTVSQYLNGAIPLNIAAAIRFAPIFGCRPSDILDIPELREFPKAEQLSADLLWPFPSVPKSRIDALSKPKRLKLERTLTLFLQGLEHEESEDNQYDEDSLHRGRRSGNTR